MEKLPSTCGMVTKSLVKPSCWWFRLIFCNTHYCQYPIRHQPSHISKGEELFIHTNGLTLLHYWLKQAVTMTTQLKSLSFHVITATFSLQSTHFLSMSSTILCSPISATQCNSMCVQKQSLFSIYHWMVCLILQWEWSSSPVCSQLLLLRFNYAVLIGFGSVLWSQRWTKAF